MMLVSMLDPPEKSRHEMPSVYASVKIAYYLCGFSRVCLQNGYVLASLDIADAVCRPIEGSTASKPYSFEIDVQVRGLLPTVIPQCQKPADFHVCVQSSHIAATHCNQKMQGETHSFAGGSTEDRDLWMARLLTACIPSTWPGGNDYDGRPAPLRYSQIAIHSSKAAAEGLFKEPPPKNPLEEALPDLKTIPAWQQPSMLLRKVYQCSVLFDVSDAVAPQVQKDRKRQVLLEVRCSLQPSCWPCGHRLKQSDQH
jgi:hypothetical protein